MLALLSFLDDQQRNRYGYENDDFNGLEYPKPVYRAPYGNDIDLDSGNADVGEWWNENIEPSIQYGENPFERFEPAAHERFEPAAHERFEPAAHERFEPATHERFVPKGLIH